MEPHRYLAVRGILEPKLDQTHIRIRCYETGTIKYIACMGWWTGALEMERLTDSQVIHDCIALLAQFTKSQIPAPIKYYCTRWHSNPFVRGAYSYISTVCDKNGTSSQLLSMPITVSDLGLRDKESTQFAKNLIMLADLDLANNQQQEDDNHSMPIILFSGEACHQQYFSTAHGAFLSGIEQAEKILKFYN